MIIDCNEYRLYHDYQDCHHLSSLDVTIVTISGYVKVMIDMVIFNIIMVIHIINVMTGL